MAAARRPSRVVTIVALSAWAFLAWVILTWTLTLEQLVVGGVLSILVAVALAPLGPAQGPWWLLHPRRFLAVIRLVVETAGRVLVANVKLSARIWSPRPPAVERDDHRAHPRAHRRRPGRRRAHLLAGRRQPDRWISTVGPATCSSTPWPCLRLPLGLHASR